MARPRNGNAKAAPSTAEDLLDSPTELVLDGKEASAYERYVASAKALQQAEATYNQAHAEIRAPFDAAQQRYREALIALNNAACPPPAQKAG